MATITTRDGISIFYRDQGRGPVVVMSHGWPLSADSWEIQAAFLASRGCRVITHDRRGHGRSGESWEGNNMDTYADDLADLVEALDLRDITLVGFSTGGGEVARYIGRHGTARVARAALVAAVPPLMLKTEANPGGLPVAVFDEIRAGFVKDRSQLFRDLSGPFFGANRENSKATQGMRDAFWFQGMQASFQGALDCIRAFSETDFTADLARFDIPTLVIHGDDDQIVPFAAAGLASSRLVPGAKLLVYEGAPHGLTNTHAERLGADLLAFMES